MSKVRVILTAVLVYMPGLLALAGIHWSWAALGGAAMLAGAAKGLANCGTTTCAHVTLRCSEDTVVLASVGACTQSNQPAGLHAPVRIR